MTQKTNGNDLVCGEKCTVLEDGEHFFQCKSCGLHLPYGLYDRLNKKIKEIEEELTWEIPNRRVFEPSAFLYYLKQIRGDNPMMPKQECPNDI